jgi:hypothetical protein
MLKLNDSQKEDVKKLIKTPWFKVIELLFTEFQNDILNKYIVGNLDLKDDKILNALNADKDFVKWGKAFIETIKSSTSWIWKKDKD